MGKGRIASHQVYRVPTDHKHTEVEVGTQPLYPKYFQLLAFSLFANGQHGLNPETNQSEKKGKTLVNRTKFDSRSDLLVHNLVDFASYEIEILIDFLLMSFIDFGQAEETNDALNRNT